MIEKEIVSAHIFMEAVLIHLPTICDYYPDIKDKMAKRDFTLQVKIVDNDFNASIAFVVDKGEFSVSHSMVGDADIEFTFGSVYSFNSYFSGRGSVLPKIKGLLKVGLFKDVVALLVKYSQILWQRQVMDTSVDKMAQIDLLSRIFSSAIDIIKSEELVEVINYFGAEQNILIHSQIVENAMFLPDITLSYAPNENTSVIPRREFNLEYDTACDAIATLLSVIGNSHFDALSSQSIAVNIVNYFAMKIEYYTRLNFRD